MQERERQQRVACAVDARAAHFFFHKTKIIMVPIFISCVGVLYCVRSRDKIKYNQGYIGSNTNIIILRR
jgi:hypothetical protein